jgi:hypothetical protein
MIAALTLMVLQGALGTFDTVYYHEYKARLPAGGARTRPELWLHAARDMVYAILFATLPSMAWCGAWAWALIGLVAFEIIVTMVDFAVEVRVRVPIGVLPGERVTHGLMAIVYGAVLASLAPHVLIWSALPTALAPHGIDVPTMFRSILAVMAGGVFVSGLRDAYAALGLPGGAYPWARDASEPLASARSDGI